MTADPTWPGPPGAAARRPGPVVPGRGVGTTSPPGRDADALLRDAVLIRRLLDDLDADDHVGRTRLLDARDAVRLEAAQLWRAHGWRPITDSRGGDEDWRVGAWRRPRRMTAASPSGTLTLSEPPKAEP